MELRTATFFELVRDNLQTIESLMRETPITHHPHLAKIIDEILSSGGKRIRPTIVLLVGGMLKTDLDQTLALGASIEMLHTATLIHDDLVDGSLVRRGNPTLNAQSSAGVTVLTGDYLFARAADLANQTDCLELYRRFTITLMTIVNGEITQLYHTHSDDLRRDYLDRIYAKTASLIELASVGPALLSEVGEQSIDALELFGHNLGLAFQIVDDILDFTGDQEQVGKPVASDLRQGLITLPAICYQEINPDDERLQIILNGGNLGEKDLRQLVQAIRDSGAIDRALLEAKDLIDVATDQLNGFPDSAEREALKELSHYIVNRSV